jgi:hypothetical protein
MTLQKIYIAIGILVVIAFFALMGRGNSEQDLIASIPTVVPGEINSLDVFAPGQKVIAGPLLGPDGGIIYVLEDGGAREIM